MNRKTGVMFRCDICGLETFVEDKVVSKQDPFPEGWVHLRSQLRTSGHYRSASMMGAVIAG